MEQLELSKTNTKLASQRTLLAYMRTGFGIASIAGAFKKTYIVVFGLFMILLSSVQYYLLLQNIEEKTMDLRKMHYLPLIYVILSIAVLYLQFYK